jgi:glycosyltransferase A (GT-A) superfamily protein (DUF2064 family)
VALVGTDIPWVSRDLVRRAFLGLASAEVVLGPAHDGGYYLVALPRPQPALFEGMEWSTPGVLAATRERASALGLRVQCLEPMHDIDTFDDLRDTWERLEPLLGRDPDLRLAVARAFGRS